MYFAVSPMNVSSFEFNFVDFELLHCYNALPKRSRSIKFSQKPFIHEICEINPTQALRLLQYINNRCESYDIANNPLLVPWSLYVVLLPFIYNKWPWMSDYHF